MKLDSYERKFIGQDVKVQDFLEATKVLKWFKENYTIEYIRRCAMSVTLGGRTASFHRYKRVNSDISWFCIPMQ
ncbi:hypothetical protein BRADI_4g08824v3 [Brachypodium distachyon]|uniref:Uncharacterized protein n=1 Tax=Brachypodium distachyon TaxID=15368 RepID=A0A0Q3H0X7_BRADI|nr:hypothetical protein BRADI_4g08824v3 [Brachypodium distachyon]